jgi:hypothetical protein
MEYASLGRCVHFPHLDIVDLTEELKGGGLMANTNSARGMGHLPNYNVMDDFVRGPHSDMRLQTNTESWSRCATAVRDYDRRIVRSWHQELDTLLVFVSAKGV